MHCTNFNEIRQGNILIFEEVHRLFFTATPDIHVGPVACKSQYLINNLEAEFQVSLFDGHLYKIRTQHMKTRRHYLLSLRIRKEFGNIVTLITLPQIMKVSIGRYTYLLYILMFSVTQFHAVVRQLTFLKSLATFMLVGTFLSTAMQCTYTNVQA